MESDFKISEFNEAKFKMLRIHELQEIINLCSGNLNGKFFMTEGKYAMYNGKRNYEIKHNLLNQLLIEIIDKLKSSEYDQITLTQTRLDTWIEEHPIHRTIAGSLNNDNKEREIYDDASYKIFKKLLFEYNRDIITLASKHGFVGREVKNPSKAIAEMS